MYRPEKLYQKQIIKSNMGEIYRRAKSAFAWIGRPEQDESQSESNTPFKLLKEESAWSSLYQNYGPRLWVKLAAICALPHWHRLWVVQEVLLGTKLMGNQP